GEEALHHPTAWVNRKADLIGVLAHDLDRDAGGGGDARGVISTVGEGGPDERPEAAGSLQERAGPIAVLNVGRMGKDQQHPPVCVHQRKALAGLHILRPTLSPLPRASVAVCARWLAWRQR